jgi:hypothetical protein
VISRDNLSADLEHCIRCRRCSVQTYDAPIRALWILFTVAAKGIAEAGACHLVLTLTSYLLGKVGSRGLAPGLVKVPRARPKIGFSRLHERDQEKYAADGYSFHTLRVYATQPLKYLKASGDRGYAEGPSAATLKLLHNPARRDV